LENTKKPSELSHFEFCQKQKKTVLIYIGAVCNP